MKGVLDMRDVGVVRWVGKRRGKRSGELWEVGKCEMGRRQFGATREMQQFRRQQERTLKKRERLQTKQIFVCSPSKTSKNNKEIHPHRIPPQPH